MIVEYRRDRRAFAAGVATGGALAVRHDHSHHLAIGLADHEYAHPEFALEFAGHPVRLRDADLSSDADRILDHPVTGVAEITPR